MTEQKSDERRPVDQWLALNRILQLHRALNLAAAALVVVLLGVILFATMRSPLVVVTDGFNKRYYQSEHQSNPINERDVSNFVRDFLEDLLTWDQLAPDSILARVSPLATTGLLDRMRQQLVNMAEKTFKGKAIAEAITNIKIQVTEKEVVATFDKVLRVDGVPLVIPSELGFNLIKGAETKWNPLGLYVNGLVEHDGTKN